MHSRAALRARVPRGAGGDGDGAAAAHGAGDHPDTLPPEDAAESYVTNTFLYNKECAVLLLPAAAVLLAFGGKLVLGVLATGILAVYLLDSLGKRDMSFNALWTTLALAQVALLASGFLLLRRSFFNLLLLFNMGIFVGVAGIWFSLQFSHLRVVSPTLPPTLERLLFAVAPVNASVILAWAASVFVGITNAPFYLLLFLSVGYYFFGIPRLSSFSLPGKPVKRGTPESYVCGKFDNAVHTISLLTLPAVFYGAVHHSTLFDGYLNMCNMVLLSTLPLLFVRVHANSGSLWWTGLEGTTLGIFKALVTTASMLVITACFEYRVIFSSYYHYVVLPEPYNYIAVTVALYSVLLVVATHFSGFLRHRVGQTGSMLVLLPSAAAWSFAMGLPLYLFPASLGAAACLVHFYFQRKIVSYVGMVAATLAPLGWFCVKTFGFLDFTFDLYGMSVQQVSLWLVILFGLAMLIPGVTLVVDETLSSLLGLLLILHGVGLAVMEQMIYEQEADFYPSMLVIGTSALGVYLTVHLQQYQRIGAQASWILASVYASKSSILLGPMPMAIPSALLLLLTITPLYFDNSARMTRRQGALHIASIGVAAFLTRETIQFRVLELLLGQAPSDSTVFAAFLVTWSLGCLPLSYWYFPHMLSMRRLNVLLLGTGVLFALLQPAMTLDVLAGGAAAEAFPHSTSLTTLGTRSLLAPWLLLVSLVLAAAAFTALIPLAHSNLMRVLFAAVIGMSSGMYVVTMYMPAHPVLYGVFCATFVLFVLFVVWAIWPSTETVSLLPVTFALLSALLPVTFFLQARYLGGQGGIMAREVLVSAQATLLGLYAAFFVTIALVVKIKVSSAQQHPRGRRSAAAAAAVGGPGAVGSARSTDRDFLPYIGNVSAITALVLSVFINIHYFHGSETCIFFLAPMLLLLNQDSVLFRGLTQENRYFPIIAATSLFLIANATYTLVLRTLVARHIFGAALVPGQAANSSLYQLKNMGLLLINIPAHYYFNQFLWNFSRQSSMMWMILMPLSVIALLFADVGSVQKMAVLALVGGVICLYADRRLKVHGNRLI